MKIALPEHKVLSISCAFICLELCIFFKYKVAQQKYEWHLKFKTLLTVHKGQFIKQGLKYCHFNSFFVVDFISADFSDSECSKELDL